MDAWDGVGVIDLETTVKNKGSGAIGSFKANPFNRENFVVCAGVLSLSTGKEAVWDYRNPTRRGPVVDVDYVPPPPPPEVRMVVGHNITFDLHYLMRDKGWREWLRTGKIWDTMVVEYLLTGQTTKMASLDSLSEQVAGGTLKNATIKDYWDNGWETEDIPRGILHKYVVEDVRNTCRIFENQLSRASSQGMVRLIHEAMEARLATTEIEWNGMRYDGLGAEGEQMNLEVTFEALKEILTKMMGASFKSFPKVEVNPESNEQISAWLFGGTLKYREREVMLGEDGVPILFKSGPRKGTPRTKWQEHTVDVAAYLDGHKWSVEGKKKGTFSTSEEVLKKIEQSFIPNSALHKFVSAVLKMREIAKDLSSFYEGYGKLVFPDGCIHPTYNHAVTGTGRLSCSNPNLQQAAHKKEE